MKRLGSDFRGRSSIAFLQKTRAIVSINAGPALGVLSLNPSSAVIGVAYSGTLSGRSAGSLLALAGPGSAGLSIDSSTGTVTGTPALAGTVDVVETLAGNIGSPRTSTAVLSVTSASTPGSPFGLLLSLTKAA